MKNEFVLIKRAIGEFFLLSVLALLPTVLIYFDVIVIKGNVGESSATEIVQATLLLLTVLIFWHGVWRHPDRRGFLVLTAGFFSCMMVREIDGVLGLIRHSFWVWPAVLTAVGSITYTIVYCRSSVIEPAAKFVRTIPYAFIQFGLITLLVFSRTFGSGNLIWKKMMGVAYDPILTGAYQEGIELFGYLFIFYGAVLFLFKNFDAQFHSRENPF